MSMFGGRRRPLSHNPAPAVLCVQSDFLTVTRNQPVIPCASAGGHSLREHRRYYDSDSLKAGHQRVCGQTRPRWTARPSLLVFTL